MVDGDLRDQIARLESDIEQLAEGLERCRKAMLLSKGAIAAGGICILAYFLGIRFDPTTVIGALAAIIMVVLSFLAQTWLLRSSTMAAMKDAEAKRTELIGNRIDLRSVGSQNGRQAGDYKAREAGGEQTCYPKRPAFRSGTATAHRVL
jgi:hypothetical protein